MIRLGCHTSSRQCFPLLQRFQPRARPHSKIELVQRVCPFSTTETQAKGDLIYEGPFSSVVLRLKCVSIISATVGSIGLPLLITYTEKTALAAGAVGGTAMIAAVGSTLLLNYCTNPYVHRIEQNKETNTLNVTSANMLGIRFETLVKIPDDLVPAAKAGGGFMRPFCNFIGAGVPFYVHGELLNDKKLARKILGASPYRRRNACKSRRKVDKKVYKV